jgi:zinc transport system substrate-binding protein
MGIARKIWISAGLVLAVGLTLSGTSCRKGGDVWPGGPPRVLVSFPPLYSFAKSVAGNDATVLSLMTSQGPHEHTPDHDDALKFQKANLFFMNGLQLEKKDFLEKLKESTGNHDVRIIDLGDAIRKDHPKVLLTHEEEEEKGKDAHGKDAHGHDHGEGEYDPHIWLDLYNPHGKSATVLMVETICDKLCKTDPAHKKGYQQRATDYIKTLQKLRQDGIDALKGKKERKLIAMHESLRYFARSFDLTVVDSIQPQPGVEADQRKLAELVGECRKKGVRVIAVEPQYAETSANTLIDELRKNGIKDARTVVIDPMETAVGELDADFYVRKMRENIKNLEKVLK